MSPPVTPPRAVVTPPTPFELAMRLVRTRDPASLMLLMKDASYWVERSDLDAGQRLVAEQIVVECIRLMAQG